MDTPSDANEAVTPNGYEKQLELQKRVIELLRLSENKYVCGRSKEANDLETFIHSSVRKNRGGSVFVFGLSGTGKTTTVNHVLDNLDTKGLACSIIRMTASCVTTVSRFINQIYARINGLKDDPTKRAKKSDLASFTVKYYRQNVAVLKQIFESPKKYTILLVDEVDYLRGRYFLKDSHVSNNWVLQAMFEAANSPESKVLVIAISNHLELATMITEKMCQIILFRPYDEKQLMEIIKGKLNELGESYTSVINDTAILLLVRRIANTSGDLRTCLDAFTRAISQSMFNLEDKLASICSMSTTDSLSTTAESTPERFYDDSCTPKRTFSDMAGNSIELKDFQVDHRHVGSLTPTLSLNKVTMLKKKIEPLPLFQLLTLLAIAKSTKEQGDRVLALSSVKQSLLYIADILSMPNVDAENFCASGFEDAMDIFKQLGIVTEVTEDCFVGGDVPKDERCIALAVDSELLTQIVLPISPAFVGLNMDLCVGEDDGYGYNKISRSFSIKAGRKKSKTRRW